MGYKVFFAIGPQDEAEAIEVSKEVTSLMGAVQLAREYAEWCERRSYTAWAYRAFTVEVRDEAGMPWWHYQRVPEDL